MPDNNHPLFDPELVDEHLQQQQLDRPADTNELVDAVEGWVDATTTLTERNLQQSFVSDLFSTVLGYTRPRGAAGEFELLPESLSQGGDGFPDVLLGRFEQEDGELIEDERKVVGELKDPGTDLDKVDPSRLKSPIEQAFEYAITNGLSVRWVVASNMDEIRLYHHGSKNHYETWEIDSFLEDGDLTDTFWEFYFIMHRDYLLGDSGGESQIEGLMQQNLSERLDLTEDFYQFYRDAVEDVYDAIIEQDPTLAETSEGQLETIQAAQTFIHRGLVICFFSDHPSQLLPEDLLADVIERGKNLPTLSGEKIYPLLHDLFRVIDTGAPDEYPYDIFGYDGGLFEEDPVLSEIVLPDELFTETYEIGDTEIEGVLGFHEYDFHADLNEHVLGRIFEESVADIEQVRANLAEGDDNPFSGTRGDYGLFFTREGLTEFVAQHVIEDLLGDIRSQVREELGLETGVLELENPDKEFLEAYLQRIVNIRIADIACGSGAFLVSCFNHLSREARRVHEKMISAQEGQVSLRSFSQTEIDILDECLHGNDLLQEAVEISKLSVWLRSARKDTSLGMLTGNFASQDALAGEIEFEDVDETAGFGEFDLIIGNPPWGGQVSDTAEQWVTDEFGDEFDVDNMDTYELFILVACEYLDDNGRLAYVLPKTLLRSEKAEIRQHLLDNYEFERFHIMGADWFGSDIRMSTVTVQLKNTEPEPDNTFRSMTLVDEDRRKAIEGELSLSQLESAYSFDIPQSRCQDSGEIEPFRYVEDDELLTKMESKSIPVGAFCESHRGVELNKAGHVIKCPACAKWVSPPRGRDPDSEKKCNYCEVTFEYQERLAEEYLIHDDPDVGDELYMDGDSFEARYDELDIKSLDLGYDGVKYKDQEVYEGDKLFIREAGVGLSVAYHEDIVYCPRSVYVYKIRSDRDEMLDWYVDVDLDDEDTEYDGKWTDPENVPEDVDTDKFHKFLLGLMNSRVLHYYMFKRSGEIDAAEAFANMRQGDIRELPVPVADLVTDAGSGIVSEIADCVDEMQNGGELGDATDLKIDRLLLDLYGLEPGHLTYINSQMGLGAYHKKMQELYPDGKPSAPERKQDVRVDVDAAAAEAEADD